ncbi:MAG: hypothetical protein ACLQFI_21900 [Methylocella sp.]
MSDTLFELISGIESSDGYLTDTWLDRLRAFEFSPQDGAQFLAWLPNIKPHLSCCAISRNPGETDLGSPADFIEFHTGGWSGAEELIAAMLEQFWIRYFHTKWSRGGHYTFEIPTKFLQAPSPPVSPLSRAPQIAPLNDIIGYLLFSVSRSGSWQAWQLIGPDERQRFLEWAEQEVTHLGTLGWTLSAVRHEQSQKCPESQSA